MARVKDEGVRARRILEDKTFTRAFESIENDIVNTMALVQINGTEESNGFIVSLARDLQANRRLRRKLQEMANTATFAERRLDAVDHQPTRANDPRWSK